MISRTNKIIGASILIGWLCFITYRYFKTKNDISSNAKVILGKIYKVHDASRGGINYDYKYSYKDKEFTGGSTIFISTYYKDSLLNKEFPVIIDSLEPSTSMILIQKLDFSKFDMEFPDSLNWIEKIVKRSL